MSRGICFCLRFESEFFNCRGELTCAQVTFTFVAFVQDVGPFLVDSAGSNQVFLLDDDG